MKRWSFFALLLPGAVAVAAVLATGSARANTPDGNFLYQVNPLVQPAEAGAEPSTFSSPYCSTRGGVPTLVCYTPRDIKTAYDYPSNLDGSGQTIVIVVAYGSPTIEHDLGVFDAVFGLPAPPGGLQIVCPSGCPDFNPLNKAMREIEWAEETTLDIEWAHAMAPGARLVLAVTPTPYGDATNTVEAKIFADPAYAGSIVSQSFGVFESSVVGDNKQILQAHRNYELARANGMTVLAGAGDWGATNGADTEQSAFFPASDPDVLAIGGTQGNPYYNGLAGAGSQLNPLPSCAANTPCSLGLATVQCTTDVTPGPTTAGKAVCPTIGYGGEETWNEFIWPAATGGAASLLFAAPSYQSADGSGSSARTIPDVSYNASFSGGVLVYLSFLPGLPPGGAFGIAGGTSAGTPQMAAVIALANQARGSTLGFVNDKVYAIAESGAYSTAFHDITLGNNQLLGTNSGNNAGPGYDLATGWGTPDVANLVADISN